jgi:hypothetical protein
MPKRQIPSEQWADPWFMNLEPDVKLFWLYLNTSCDYAGGWKPNLKLAEFQTGLKIDTAAFLEKINAGSKRIIATPHLWFLTAFVQEQYGNRIEGSEGYFQKKVLTLHEQYLDTLSTPCRHPVDTLAKAKA